MKKSLIILTIVLGCVIIAIMVYLYRENLSVLESFDTLDEGVWTVSDKTLGRSRLSPVNVEVKDGYLNIKIPANTLDGGEIVKQEALTYGIYESRMKLPEAPSSITGFFLYAPPDYFYEIDIEIHNSSEGKLLLTTYADGAVQNEYVGELGFDPTADFHNYRFDYTADRLAFYVDSKVIQEWQVGFPVGQPMQLMVNTWYPIWLAGIPAPADQVLLVDWIRY